jgi:hypothetical protein
LDLLLQESSLIVKRHIPFSQLVNFHSLKHSVIHWAEDRFGGRKPYYIIKPLLFFFPLLERLTGRYGIFTTVAQKPDVPSRGPEKI